MTITAMMTDTSLTIVKNLFLTRNIVQVRWGSFLNILISHNNLFLYVHLTCPWLENLFNTAANNCCGIFKMFHSWILFNIYHICYSSMFVGKERDWMALHVVSACYPCHLIEAQTFLCSENITTQNGPNRSSIPVLYYYDLLMHWMDTKSISKDFQSDMIKMIIN